jgi:hypothetical protein
MSAYWTIMLFNLQVSNCVANFPFTLFPFTNEEKKELCIEIVLDAERRERR